MSIYSGDHFPLYSGFFLVGDSHFPHPEASSHFGFGTEGDTQSPSSSSSQSSGFSAPGSGIIEGSFSSQSSGLTASSSTISYGASSSQSSGFVASGSGILASSTQSSGFTSLGSSISFSGLTAGEKSSRRLPFFTSSPSTLITKVWSGLTIRVYKVVAFVMRAGGALFKCFSSYSPVLGFLCLKIK